MEKLEGIESEVAYLRRALEELSDVVARQDAEISRLTRRVEMLLLREAEREANEGGAVIADQKPPHY